MRLVTALIVAGGVVVAPVTVAATASAWPSSCDGVDCVPGVARDVAAGQPCISATRYIYGVNESGTFVCRLTGKWSATKPLVGVRPLGAPCYGSTGSAQTPDGLPMSCNGIGWVLDFSTVYYGPATS